MLEVQYHSRFKKDYKKALKKGLNVSELQAVVEKLQRGERLERKYL